VKVNSGRRQPSSEGKRVSYFKPGKKKSGSIIGGERKKDA